MSARERRQAAYTRAVQAAALRLPSYKPRVVPVRYYYTLDIRAKLGGYGCNCIRTLAEVRRIVARFLAEDGKPASITVRRVTNPQDAGVVVFARPAVAIEQKEAA
jgi:hypothetical protein